MSETQVIDHENLLPVHRAYVCSVEDIVLNTGICALVNDQQIAIFRLDQGIFALSNFDPFSKAQVLSRGLVGEADGRFYVASPLLKQRFDLVTGACLDDERVSIPVFAIEVVQGSIYIKSHPQGIKKLMNP